MSEPQNGNLVAKRKESLNSVKTSEHSFMKSAIKANEATEKVFGNLFGADSSSEDEEEYFVTETVGEGHRKIEVYLHIPEEDKVQRTLFANAVWSGSKILAQYVWENYEIINQKKILEVGAGAGLPGIVAAKVGAKAVTLSDYPSDHLLEILWENLIKNVSSSGSTEKHESIQGIPHSVVGHLWGEDIKPLIQAKERNGKLLHNEELFDVILASECLWCHDLHTLLLRSMYSCLKPGGFAWVTFSHHIPGLESEDLSFFTKAETMGFVTEFLKKFPGKAMWSDKQVDLFLYCIKKPETETKT